MTEAVSPSVGWGVVHLFCQPGPLLDGEAVRAAVKETHSYVTPSIVFLPAEGGDPAYLGWILAETQRAAEPEPAARADPET